MKKVLCVGLIVTALTTGVSAMAVVDENSLTTKGYVDSGLRAVYQVAKDAENAIGTASNGENTGTGLIGRIENLESAAGTNGSLQQLIGATSDGVNPGSGILGDIETLQNQVAGKQNALSAQQLNAVNSGITSGLVTQIGTNADNISGLQSAVGTASSETTSGTGLTGRIESLESDVLSLQTGAVSAGTGIAVSGNTISVAGLNNTTGANAGNVYVYKNGALTELPMATTWSDSVLTSGQ